MVGSRTEDVDKNINVNGFGNNGDWGRHFHFQRRTVRLKDKREVREAQSRVMHVVSLVQLETIMLGDYTGNGVAMRMATSWQLYWL